MDFEEIEKDFEKINKIAMKQEAAYREDYLRTLLDLYLTNIVDKETEK